MAFLMRRRLAPWFPGTRTKSVASHEGDDDDDTLGSSSWTIASHESNPWESLDDANTWTQKGDLAAMQWWRTRLRRESDEEVFKSEMRPRTLVVLLGILVALQVYHIWNYPPSSFFFRLRLTFACIYFWIATMVWRSDSFRRRFLRQGHKWFAVLISTIHTARFLGIMSLDAAGVASDAARMSTVLRNNLNWTALSLSGFPCGSGAGCGEDRFGPSLLRGYETMILAIITFSVPLIDDSLSFQGIFWVLETMSLVATFHLVGASLAAVLPFAMACAASGLANVVLSFYLKPVWCRAQQRIEVRLGQIENEKERLEWEKRILESECPRFPEFPIREELGFVPERASDSSSSISLTPSETVSAMFLGDAVLPNQEL